MKLEPTGSEFRQSWHEFVSQAQPPEWVRKMIDHYWQTGSYRPEDLRRLLGDPSKGVEVGPNVSIASFLTSKRPQAS